MNLQIALEQRAKVEEFQRKHRIVLLTLLFTDMVGSTQLKQELGDREAVALIQRLRALVRGLLSRFNEGEEIETAGDSFFIVFAKPSDGVLFSLMLQSKLRDLGEEMGRPLLNRIGLHIGEVVIEERADSSKRKDLYGLQVDLCGRVMSLAEGDQILMTRSAFDNARQVLKGEAIEGVGALSWLNHGPYVLKGVDEPMEICEVGEVGLAVLKAPPDSEKVHRYVSPDSEPVLGWRPAIGQGVPGTSWVLEEKLGEGGFGEVWLGRHKTTKERRVFKFCFRADRVRSLKREVTLFRVMKERLGEHPHIVGVQDVYLEEAPYYLTMEYVAGRDLKTWSEANGGVGAIPLETRLEIVAQVAEALQAAHDAGVIHRDVKPSNILVAADVSWRADPMECGGLTPLSSEEGHESRGKIQSAVKPAHSKIQVKLTDFGIGQVVSEEVLAGMTRLGFTETLIPTGRGAQAGTYLYMAPELLAGKPASKQSDIYSLGVVLYQLLVGGLSRPITTDWAAELEDLLLREDLSRCTAANPHNRFSSAVELARNLRGWEKRRLERELAEARKQAEEEARQRHVAEEHARQLQAAYDQVTKALNRWEIQKAEELFAGDDASTALAYLARVLRRDPNHTVAAHRAISALLHRSFALPLVELPATPLPSGGGFGTIEGPYESAEASFSPDGERVVTCFETAAKIWDAHSGQLVAATLPHDQAVYLVLFSPDGKRLLTASFKTEDRSHGSARLWDVHTGRPRTDELRFEGYYAASAQFSPNSQRLLVMWKEAGRNSPGQARRNVLRLYEVDSIRRVAEAIERRPSRLVGELHDDLMAFTRFTLDSRRFFTLSGGTVAVWDAETGEPAAAPFQYDDDVSEAHIDAHGERLIVSLAWGRKLDIWNLNSGHRIKTLEAKESESFGKVQFTLDRRSFYTFGNSVQKWDTQSGEPLSEPFRDYTEAEANLIDSTSGDAKVRLISADGERIITCLGRRRLRAWEVRTGQAVADPARLNHQLVSLQRSRDGERFLTFESDNTCRVWENRGAGPLSEPIQSRFALTQFSVGNSRLLIVGEVAQIWDIRPGQVLLERLSVRHSVRAVSRDGQIVLSERELGIVEIQ